MSLSLCHHPPPPKKKKIGEPGKSLAFSLLRISVSTVELDYSSSWPINEQENLRELELVLRQDVKHFKYGVLMSLLQLIASLVFLIVVLVVFFW